MSMLGSEEVCETECVYSVNVKDIGNVNFKVRICLGEKLIASEPTEVITIEISDLLTKSLYHAYFDLDHVGRMGTYVELEQVFVILQACLSALQKGSDSTSHRIEFGYIDAPQRADEEKDEVMYDRKSMARSRKALKQKYRKLSKDSSVGDSLILSVQFSSEIFTEFFAFLVPITNKDDETGRLMQMMKDRKLEIEEVKAERQSLQDEFEKVKAERQTLMDEFQKVKTDNRELSKKVAALEARVNGGEEGKDDTGLKIAGFYPTATAGHGSYIVWDSCTFDLLGAQFIKRENSNNQIRFQKAGYYRIIAKATLASTGSPHLCLYLNGGPVFYSYQNSANNAGYHSSPRIHQVMKMNSGDYIQIYVHATNNAAAGRAQTNLQIEFLHSG